MLQCAIVRYSRIQPYVNKKRKIQPEVILQELVRASPTGISPELFYQNFVTEDRTLYHVSLSLS